MFLKDEWLSQYFSGHAYKYVPSESQNILSPSGFIYTKISVENCSQVNYLLQKGFYLTETLLNFEQQSIKSLPPNADIRWATHADKKDVCTIAADAFIYSRLYHDPLISSSLASQIKTDWVANFFQGQRGNGMVVAQHGTQVMGFLLLIDEIIDLIAIAPSHQNKGLARSMISFANQHRGLLKAGTQLINKASLALYQTIDFKLKHAFYVLHCHK